MMKIRCDVCDIENASVFCSADEAALCNTCDFRVHHANKLAGKHLRFPLIHTSFSESPRCDICQEKRAFLFCKEDRAIFCKECDATIHTTKEQMYEHNRFLLTGVKLSAFSSLSSSTCLSSIDPHLKKFAVSSNRVGSVRDNNQHQTSHSNSVSTSSVSEYLMETLPGWCVDDFLDPSYYSNNYYLICGTQHIH